MAVKLVAVLLVGLALVSVHSAEAQQQAKVPWIGYVVQRNAPSLTTPDLAADAFRKGLHDLGYIEGKNIRLEYRYSGGMEDVSSLAQTDALSNILIEKGLITQEAFMQRFQRNGRRIRNS